MLIAPRLSLTRPLLALAALAATALALLATAQPADAAKTAQCARQVIADWYDNGRVDKIYPLHCYREAIKILPVDVRDYSSAREDILRALAYAEQGKPDPGEKGSGGTSTDPGGGGNSGSTPGGSDPGDPGDPGTTPVSAVDTSGPSAVPIPLIVLAAIAGLLLVLGAAGYLTRRSSGRDEGETP